MNAQGNLFAQRWTDRRDSYRTDDDFTPAGFEVAPIADDKTAKAFVLRHHYSASYPAARFRFGMYRGPELLGVAVFSMPCSASVLTSTFPCDVLEATELGRFVLVDGVKRNGETWFLARAFELLKREGILGVLSFSDPMPRKSTAGDVVFGGHVGLIYQAFNGRYLGRATPRSLKMMPSGRVFSDRAISKIRARERGWRYAVDELVAAGAPAPTGDLREWLARELPRVTRTVRHQGNHRYAWPLTRAFRRALPDARGPYPKPEPEQLAWMRRKTLHDGSVNDKTLPHVCEPQLDPDEPPRGTFRFEIEPDDVIAARGPGYYKYGRPERDRPPPTYSYVAWNQETAGMQTAHEYRDGAAWVRLLRKYPQVRQSEGDAPAMRADPTATRAELWKLAKAHRSQCRKCNDDMPRGVIECDIYRELRKAASEAPSDASAPPALPFGKTEDA